MDSMKLMTTRRNYMKLIENEFEGKIRHLVSGNLMTTISFETVEFPSYEAVRRSILVPIQTQSSVNQSVLEHIYHEA